MTTQKAVYAPEAWGDAGSSQPANILLIGTADTKADELAFIRDEIQASGQRCILMDVGVLGESPIHVDFTRSAVAAKSGSSLAEVRTLDHENRAMQQMALGATAIALELYDEGRLDGVLIVGGTMGTDLGLDVACGLPFGVAKVILSTVAFSPIIPPERIPSDLTMMLWAGGLWGRNFVSDAVMRQAAGAVVGAALGSRRALASPRPMVGVSSLGTSTLKYIPRLWNELSARGYDVVLFHSVGPGGRALENMAAQGQLVAVLDLCLIELSNYHLGSVAHSGASRLEAASLAGVPQIIAPGAIDAVDFRTWAPLPDGRDAAFHAHNRLVGSAATTPQEKVSIARVIAEKVNAATSPTCLIVPAGGVSEWGRPGELLHDEAGMHDFVVEIANTISPEADYQLVNAHINDPEFIEAVLDKFDAWVDEGIIMWAQDDVAQKF